MEINFWGIPIPTTWALAVVVALAYILGRCGHLRRIVSDQQRLELERQVQRARAAAGKLEKMLSITRDGLAQHQARLKSFRKRVVKLKKDQQEEVWHKLEREIEAIVGPTIHLAAQIASAHDIIRYESSILMTSTNLQTDPLTGVCNRRGLDQSLATLLGLLNRYGTPFSVVLLDVDFFKKVNDEQGHLQGDQLLRQLVKFFQAEAREVDVIARYGGDEFVIVMPQTGLGGATAMAERLRAKIERQMSCTISGGVTAAQKGDTPMALLLRVDSALYSAKSAGRNCILWHDGSHVGVAAPLDPVRGDEEAELITLAVGE
jgi:diguanylate cyclase